MASTSEGDGMDLINWYYQRRMLNAMVQNKWTEAEHFTRKLIRHRGASVGLVYNLALITLGSGRTQEAYAQLLESVETYGESLRLCRLLGDIAYLDGKRQESLQWYGKAEDEAQSPKELHLIRMRLKILSDPDWYGRVLGILSLVDQAQQAMEKEPNRAWDLYRKVVLEDPSQVEALNNLGVLELEHFHHAEQACTYFQKVLDLVDHQGAARNLAKARKA